MHVGVYYCPLASAEGVLSGRCVAVSDQVKDDQRTRILELLQHLRGVLRRVCGL